MAFHDQFLAAVVAAAVAAIIVFRCSWRRCEADCVLAVEDCSESTLGGMVVFAHGSTADYPPLLAADCKLFDCDMSSDLSPPSVPSVSSGVNEVGVVGNTRSLISLTASKASLREGCAAKDARERHFLG